MFDQPNPMRDTNRSDSNSAMDLSSQLSVFAFSSLTNKSAEQGVQNSTPKVQRESSCRELDFSDQPDGEPQKKMSNKELEKGIADKSGKRDAVSIEETKAMYRELIDRADQKLPDKAFNDSVATFDLINKALFAGRDLKERKSGVQELSNQPLSLERRWKLHVALISDMESLGQQVERRLDFSSYLKSVNQLDDAKQIGREAAAKADRLIKPVSVNGQQISPIGLFQQESAKLITDRKQLPSLEKQKEAQKASEYLMRLTGIVLKASKL